MNIANSGGNESLLSEKQAAAKLGISRITLLRLRQAGRVRFFRIGARVLFSSEHLHEFLSSVERNGPRKGKRRDIGRVTLSKVLALAEYFDAIRRDDQMRKKFAVIAASVGTGRIWLSFVHMTCWSVGKVLGWIGF